MILYSKAWGGVPILFQFRGTAWPYAILPALMSTALGLILGLIADFNDLVEEKEEFMVHPYPFQLYAFIVGFLIVFRTNFAYQRYWEGRSTIAQMDGKWLDGACMAITFDATGDSSTPYLDGIKSRPSVTQKPTKNGSPSHEHFYEEITHLFSLMHALAMQHLRQDSDLDNLKGFILQGKRVTALPDAPIVSGSDPHIRKMHSRGGGLTAKKDLHSEIFKHQKFDVIGNITRGEKAALETDAQGKGIPTGARVAMVEGWIMRRLIARQKHEGCDMEKTSPPILSRLYQVVSDGALGFSHACKLVDTPFPFPYQNIIQLFLWVYCLVVPFVMNAWLRNWYLRAILTFLATWSYYAMHHVGSNLEDPYIPYDPNELALPHIQHEFNAKLLAFGSVPVEDSIVPASSEPTITAVEPKVTAVEPKAAAAAPTVRLDQIPTSDPATSEPLVPADAGLSAPPPSPPLQNQEPEATAKAKKKESITTL